MNSFKTLLVTLTLALPINSLATNFSSSLLLKNQQLEKTKVFSSDETIVIIEKQIEWIKQQISNLADKQTQVLQNKSMGEQLREKAFEQYQKQIENYQEQLKILFERLANFKKKKAFIVDLNELNDVFTKSFDSFNFNIDLTKDKPKFTALNFYQHLEAFLEQQDLASKNIKLPLNTFTNLIYNQNFFLTVKDQKGQIINIDNFNIGIGNTQKFHFELVIVNNITDKATEFVVGSKLSGIFQITDTRVSSSNLFKNFSFDWGYRYEPFATEVKWNDTTKFKKLINEVTSLVNQKDGGVINDIKISNDETVEERNKESEFTSILKTVFNNPARFISIEGDESYIYKGFWNDYFYRWWISYYDEYHVVRKYYIIDDVWKNHPDRRVNIKITIKFCSVFWK